MHESEKYNCEWMQHVVGWIPCLPPTISAVSLLPMGGQQFWRIARA